MAYGGVCASSAAAFMLQRCRQHQSDAHCAGRRHRHWGASIINGMAEAGKEISKRPFQLVSGLN
jgi:Zn-dependent alcohol dehydrogenase